MWGVDANEWNPDRFLDPERNFREASSNIGVWQLVSICSLKWHLTDDLLQDEFLYAFRITCPNLFLLTRETFSDWGPFVHSLTILVSAIPVAPLLMHSATN